LALSLFDHDEFDNFGQRSKANTAVEQQSGYGVKQVFNGRQDRVRQDVRSFC
jgi:hypothetical protein